VKQFAVRIDADLHGRLKRRAADEGRSLNALVADLLRRATHDDDARSSLRRRLQREGRLVVPEPPQAIPTDDDLARAGRGARISDLLEEERER